MFCVQNRLSIFSWLFCAYSKILYYTIFILSTHCDGIFFLRGECGKSLALVNDLSMPAEHKLISTSRYSVLENHIHKGANKKKSFVEHFMSIKSRMDNCFSCASMRLNFTARQNKSSDCLRAIFIFFSSREAIVGAAICFLFLNF